MAVQTTEEFKNGGATSYAITIEYLKASDIKVRIDGALQTYVASSPGSGQYTVSGTTVTLGAQAASGTGNVHIYRETDVDTAAAVFVAGSSIKAADLNAIHDMARFGLSEARSTTIESDIKDGAITSAKIKDGTIVNADVNASAAIDGTKISPNFGSQNIVTSGTVDGRDVSVDGTKLDGIESGATADQTAAEIKSLYEGSSNTNAFTDAEKTKLSGIETGATADQTNAEIKTAYEANSNTNAYTDAEKTKLSGIATGAEVNVNADWNSSSGDSQILNKPTLVTSLDGLSDVNTSGVADGKILKYNASSNAFIVADDGGGTGSGITNGDKGDITVANAGTVSESFTIDSNAVTTAKIADEAVTLAKLPHGTSSTDGKFLRSNNGADPTFETVNTNLVADTTPQLGGNLDVQASEINTSTTNGNIKLNPNGTGVVEIKGDGSSADGTLQLNCSQNSHGVKIKSPAHSAGASYTLTLPNNIVNGQFLKTDTNGNLSWAAVDLTALSASNLTSGTIPDARFPATLPAVSGANLTNLPSSSYNIQINTLSSSSGTGGGSATFNGTATRFTLSNAGPNAQAHLVSVNGVIQKPNSGTSPSEGFAIDGNDIIFASAPASGADFFILTLGTAITIGTPSDETVSEAKLNVSNSPTNGYFLSAQSGNTGGLTWAAVDLTALSASNLTSGTIPDARFPATLPALDGSNLTGLASTVAGGAIYENSQTISASHTIPTGSNGMSAGPVTVNNGVTLTISNGSTYTIV